ncbi:DUF3515 domain-containing protein [Nocardia sp. NBC_01730]|uniref:DUF3515 domain-containing protein n=1 Tax=Nocardia sp. NBC_01730 TaxID=2975998 RepID=UPI002E0DDCAA|nr:DUF3515 domain-containing protein [Nocardia sp. NBC_01730]
MAADSPDRDSAEDKQPAASPAKATGSDTEATAPDAGTPAAEEEVPDRSARAAGTDAVTTKPADDATDPAAAGDTSPAVGPTRQYSPALIATAVALPVVLVVAVLVAAVLARRAPVDREPLVLGPVPAPAAAGPSCTALLPALPADLGEFTKSTLVEPAPPATRAWQRDDGGDPIVLRCGLDRPLEFNRAAPLQIVNAVQWFEVRDQAAKTSTWFAVDRETYLALTVPDGSGPTPLQEVSDTVTATLPAQPIDPGPIPN